ncbi:MAG: polyprenyl synthetase family protein [Ignavibacteriales bacterium]|nr:polyprenyl synthetase family protein [Ignavibacteriales bacterium]
MNHDTEKYCSDLFEKQRKIVEAKIENIFNNKLPESLYEPCSYIVKSGGKRLRPMLVLFSAKAVGGRYSDVYNAAIAVELLHNFSLVHDDIMDNSNMRRGRLTLHKKYDLSTAILTGDNLIAVAYSFLLKDCSINFKSVVSTFTNGVIQVCEGQSLDKEFETRSNVSIKDYIIMIEKKTAALLETCCSLGVQLCGGDSAKIKALSNYGKYLGIAFQIQDDLLDIAGDENEFGKIIGGDIVEGKKTFLFLRALEKAKGNTLKELQSVIKNKGVQRKEVGKFKEIYLQLGVMEDAKKEIIKYSSKALSELKFIPSIKDKEMLTWITHLLIKRNK